jgi:quinoprotein glucose dehydrogenase
VIVGAALLTGTAPVSKENVPGYVRGFDVRTGKRIWTFHTIAQPGELGNETWEKDSWKYTGNTAVWAPMSADEELGYVYLPVETPTGDYYGGHRLGDNLFAETLVCLDARTGKRIWHYQFIHHGIWDWDIPTAPSLIDITVNGKKIKAVAQVTKQAFTYVFDRVTGPAGLADRGTRGAAVAGARREDFRTQPFPTKPAPFDRQGVSLDDVIDFTPELKAEAVKIASEYQLGPIFTPPSIFDANGKKGTLQLPAATGGSNWQGGAVDPETGILYVSSVTNPSVIALYKDGKRSDMDYISGAGAEESAEAGGNAQYRAAGAAADQTTMGEDHGDRSEQRRSCVDEAPNGQAPEYIRNHPAMKGIDLSQAGNPERAPLLVTKALLFAGDGSGLFAAGPGGGGPMFRAMDKKTGDVVFEMKLPGNETG